MNRLSIPLLTGIFFMAPATPRQPRRPKALQNFGIGAAQIDDPERGEIISYEVSETRLEELAIGVARIKKCSNALKRLNNDLKRKPASIAAENRSRREEEPQSWWRKPHPVLLLALIRLRITPIILVALTKLFP